MATKKKQVMFAEEPVATETSLAKKEGEPTPLVKSILNVLNGSQDSIERLAFETDPSVVNQYHSVYKAKLRLIPDAYLKRIAIQDDLVAAIVQARSNQMSAFGRPRPDRFSTGYIIEPKVGVVDKLDEEQKEELDRRIEAAIKKLGTCGETKGWDDADKLTFAQWLSMSSRNAIIVGRLATEIIWVMDEKTGKKKFHSFRPIDAGTIFKATPQKTAQDSIRTSAKAILEQLAGKRLIPEKFQEDEYAWVQVVEGRPLQAFTSEECCVHNFYPVPDVELDGYPVTPLDTIISAVTTHINITTHNKLYFQSGRASRGMLVIKSDDVDETVIGRIKQQFNASINSVDKAWRMPVFSVSSTDDITWQPIDQGGGKDMEFQYLTDMNARIILSAFMMSPEELPGWSYLSRGTNNQALSEANNEYKLEAARDLGIRPLMSQFEDFINAVIFPLIDEQLSKLCQVKLVGLDAETEEKESVRIQQDMAIHMTYNEVLEKVEKKPIPKELFGDFPLNPQYQAVLDKYCPVGAIVEAFAGLKGAAQDPNLQYFRDPFWFQFQQLQLQKLQLQMQQQQMVQQAQQAQEGGGMNTEDPQGPGENDAGPPGQDGGGDDGGGAPPDGGGSPDGGVPTEKQKTDQVQSATASPEDAQDLTRSVDQAIALLSKSEEQLPPSKRRLLAQHKRMVSDFMKGFEEDAKRVTEEIIGIAEKHGPKRN